MKSLVIITVLFAYSCSLSAAEEINRDGVAAKLGYGTWANFLSARSVAWDWQRVDSSKFTPDETLFILNWARQTEGHWPNTAREGCRVGFVLLLKFKDPKAISYVDKQLSRGWYWAWNAAEAVENTGELSLIPLAAKYLWVDQPSEPMPEMGDVIFSAEPSGCAAQIIASLLRDSYQSPDTIRKAAADRRIRYHETDVYRRWWQANEDRCRKGDFSHLSSPLDYLTETTTKQ